MITKNEFLEYLRANYIGWKLWTKEDIAAMLRKQGYSACASNISAVMRSGLDGLNDCTDHGLEIIESAISDAEWRGYEFFQYPSKDEYMEDAIASIRNYRETNGLPEFILEFDERCLKLLIDKTRCVSPCQFYEADEKAIYGFTDEEWEREAPVNVWVDLETRTIETEVNGVVVEQKVLESDREVLDFLNLMTPEILFSKETPKDRLAAALQFYLHEDLTNMTDSMEFDSGTEIATLSFGDSEASIMVCGEVRVTYKDEVYRQPSEFPEELKEIIRAGHVFDHEDVYVGNNNWFAIQFRDGTEWDPNDNIVDVEGLSKQEIFSLMWDALSSHLEHQRRKEEVITATVLTDFVEYLREWAITDDDRKFNDKVDYAVRKYIEQRK